MRSWHFLLIAIVFGGTQTAHAQFRFESDWLFWDRDNGASTDFVIGGGGASTNGANFEVESGYRLQFGGAYNDFEVDFIFSQVQGWDASTSGVLNRPLSFDNEFANPMIFMAPAAQFGFLNSLNTAASNTFLVNIETPNPMFDPMAPVDPILNPATILVPTQFDETTEGEFLENNATFQTRYSSRFDSYELNVGTNRDWSWWHVALGSRVINLDEFLEFQTVGTFDALDSDDGAAANSGMTDDPNNQLSHEALIASGLQLISGGADGWDAIDFMNPNPDSLALAFDADIENSLVGGQFTFSGRLYPGDFLTLEGIGKVGAYHNRIKGRITERYTGFGNDDSVYGRTYTDSRSVGSFVGGVGIRALITVFEYVDFTVGYEALFITNVGLSPDQLGGIRSDAFGNLSYRARSHGNVVMHGGQAGLSVTW